MKLLCLSSRWANMIIGLALIGLSIAFTKKANLGLGPWDVLSDGLAQFTGMQLGTMSIIIGVIVLLLWIPLREKPGLALVPNILLIGAFTNVGLSIVHSVNGVLLRTVWLLTGLMLAAFGTVLYLGSELGAGPRDGLMLALSRRTGWSLRLTRTLLEVFVLIVGYVLGGAVGIGTVVLALTIGPAVQLVSGKPDDSQNRLSKNIRLVPSCAKY